jgi:hypothetical protein
MINSHLGLILVSTFKILNFTLPSTTSSDQKMSPDFEPLIQDWISSILVVLASLSFDQSFYSGESHFSCFL